MKPQYRVRMTNDGIFSVDMKLEDGWKSITSDYPPTTMEDAVLLMEILRAIDEV